MNWSLAIIAILGIGNFVIQRAVLVKEPEIARLLAEFLTSLGGKLAWVAEFAKLLTILLLTAKGWTGLDGAGVGLPCLDRSEWYGRVVHPRAFRLRGVSEADRETGDDHTAFPYQRCAFRGGEPRRAGRGRAGRGR